MKAFYQNAPVEEWKQIFGDELKNFFEIDQEIQNWMQAMENTKGVNEKEVLHDLNKQLLTATT